MVAMTSRRPAAPRALARTTAGAAPVARPEAAVGGSSVDVLARESAPTAAPADDAPARPRARQTVRVRRSPRGSSRPDRGAASSRPDRRPRAARTARDEAEEDRPPRTITMRTLVLALVLLVAFIVLAPTARAFIVQTEHQRRVQAEQAAVSAEVERLESQLERWTDISYIQAQARERLGFVMPGETPYRVIDPETVPVEDGAEFEDLQAAVNTAPQVPWYLTLSESVEEAGALPEDEPTYTLPEPAPSATQP